MFVDKLPIERAVCCRVVREFCCSCTHPGKWKVFHLTPDLNLAWWSDCEGEEVSYSPQESQLQTFLVAALCIFYSAQFPVTGGWWQLIDSGGFNDGDAT